MQLRNSFLLSAFAGILTFSSCRFIEGQRVYGNGHITSQDRNPGNFNSVDAGGAMDVHLSMGSSSVKIQADENLLPYIETYVQGNTLVVRTRQGFDLNSSKNIIVYVTAPVFKTVEVSGSGDIVSDNTISGSEPLSLHVSGAGNIQASVELPKVSTDISGSGDLELKGRVQDFSADISGSGKVKCFDLQTDNTSLDLAGSSDAEVSVNKKLDISVSGSGSVRYKGNATVSQHISGSGDVTKVN